MTDRENQPNQYGVEFGMSGQQMHFKIGNQLFRLAYEPDDQQEFEFMKRMLIHAFSTFTPDVKMAQHPATHVQNPAEIEHVADDVSKNGAEVNTNVYAELPPSYYLAGGVEKTWDQQQMHAFADRTHALRAQQPAPAAGITVEQVEDAIGLQSTAWDTIDAKKIVEAVLRLVNGQAPATQQAGEVVAYLDVGANGYLDLGSELSEDALQQLPKGRHALVIAGTYGIDGYVAAPQPSPTAPAAESVLEDAARLDWLALAGPVSICLVIDRPHDGEVEVATDDVTGYGKTLREALDAARKQGVNHDQ